VRQVRAPSLSWRKNKLEQALSACAKLARQRIGGMGEERAHLKLALGAKQDEHLTKGKTK
jgi:hypothetical protein